MSETGGIVYLVGAGPGDPGLITVRGLNLLRRADVILHDRLIDAAVLNQARRDAEIIYVGKTPRAHRVGQDQTNALLIRYARAGKTVVRLKGGDPYVFGRGFEELSACRQAGVSCRVVPGVSSALAVPVAAGIPITRRSSVRSFAVITGSFAGECQAPPLDFAALAKMDTLIVMMGRAPLGDIASSLIDAGRDSSVPAASIENGTTPAQRVVRATLGTIAHEVDRHGLESPVVTVIGDAAAEARSEQTEDSEFPSDNQTGLLGCRIALTRPRTRSKVLRRALARVGAQVIDCPMIEIEFLHQPELPKQEGLCVDRYDWIAFTSVYGVEGFVRYLHARRADARALAGIKIAAVGSATTLALKRFGIVADLVPEQSCAAAMVHTLIVRAETEPHTCVLYPCGDRALATLERGLADAGIGCEALVVYRTIDATPDDETMALLRDGVDIALFHSPSAVKRFAALGLDRADTIAACVGPTTAQSATGFRFGRITRLDKCSSHILLKQLAELCRRPAVR